MFKQRWVILMIVAALTACGGGSQTSDADATSTSETASQEIEQNSTEVTPGTTELSSGETVTSTQDVSSATESSERPTETAKAVTSTTQSVSAVTVADGSSDVSYTFERDFTSVAPGWYVNWWGSPQPGYEAQRETRSGFVYEGSVSQRFRVNSVPTGGGAHLVFQYGFAQNAAYTAAVYLRADATTDVEVQLRRDVSPYNMMSRKRVTVGTSWQRVDLGGTYLWADVGSMRIVPISTGVNIYVDKMSITKTTPTTTTTAVAGGLTLPAAGAAGVQLRTVRTANMDAAFTRFAPNLYYNAYGGTAPGEFLATRETRAGYVYAGAASQKFQVINKKGGVVELTMGHPFEFGKIYRATAYIKADTATPVQVYMRRDQHPWDPFGSKSITATSTWQKVEIEGTYIGSVAGTLRFNVQSATGTIYVDEVVISEVQKNDMAPVSTATVPDTLFGMHVNRVGTHFKWPGMSTGLVRLWNTGTTWRDIEKSNNVWDFNRLDVEVNYVRSHSTSAAILYTLGQTPYWASSSPTVSGLFGLGATGAPKNMEDWRDYVRTLARRYVGKIRYWELWNEPDFYLHWTGGNANLIEMARIAKQELVAADPNNKLVSPGFTTGQGMPALDAFLRGGGGQYVDIIGFHWYYSTNPESIGLSMDNVRGIMKTYGQQAKPLWNTEGAFICNNALRDCATTGATAAEKRAMNARAMFIMALKGIGSFSYYVWESQDDYRKLVELDFTTPTQAGTAFAEARTWLKGASIADAYRISDKVYVVRLRRGTTENVVLWATTAGTLVNLPSAWSVNTTRTVMGAEAPIPSTRQLTLGLEPVLLK